MPSPFISVARRRSRLGQSSRLKTGAAVAMVALLALVVPAVAASHASSSAASPIAVAKKALRLATGANKTANKALKFAKRAPADNSVTSRKIVNGSVSTADLSGADITGTISGIAGAVPANNCTTLAIDLGGARVGDAAFITFIGDVPAPQGLTFEIIKVTSANQGTMRLCNPTNVASSVFAGVGVRVITFH